MALLTDVPEQLRSWVRTPRPVHVDARGIEEKLRARLSGEVRFDSGSRALYATDGSNHRQIPIGVVVPRTKEDIVRTVETCREFGAPILARGGGTSLAGQCCNVAVVMDASKYYNRILELDPGRKIARVQPGLVLDTLRDAAEKHKLTFGPDPATHNHCTLGGMIGNNSCGIHALMAGKTSENVFDLEVLTYDGTIMRVGPTTEDQFRRIASEGGRRADIYSRVKSLIDRNADAIRRGFPDIPRRVSGYNFPEVLPEAGYNIARGLVGSECTLALTLEATLRLVYSPPKRSLVVLGYPDIYVAGDHIPEILEAQPIGLEGIDVYLVTDMKRKGLHPRNLQLLPEGRGWLLVEFGGESKDESDGKAKQLMERLSKKPDAPSCKLFDDPGQEALVWQIRESGLGATAFIPGQPLTWEGWEDSAVDPKRLGGYLREFCKLLEKHGYKGALYGHFGQGCVHTRINFDLFTADGIANYRAFVTEAAHLVVKYGGSLSGEHGDGQSRGELLPIMFDQRLLDAFREFKEIWDPDWKMNPGKLVDPYPLDSNLRLGTHYNPPHVSTHFAFPDDEGSFAMASLRCVGVGECRKHGDGTMCPSYMVTLEEKHTTRGRAHLLFEMMRGEVITDMWKSEAVKEALDLCLACKGCKHECPVNVDMATYKAEFLSHYYEGRLRPRHAYAMGLIDKWARIASVAPGVANFCTQTPGLSALAKLAGGIARERQMPKFAPVTFRDWFRRRQRTPPRRNAGGPQVMLWPDTFNNYFKPRTAAAAVEILEEAGYEVTIPDQVLCCGRPLYDFGMLTMARRYLERILSSLRPQIEEGIPIVILEPSCCAVFRDEMVNLLHDNQDVKRLHAQALSLEEFLTQKADGWKPPRLQRQALLHGHCHQKAIMRLDSAERLLQRMELDYDAPPMGCCGMAGSFGFEAEHYDVSMKAGERALLPAVRNADKHTIIISDGFSCREQIEQGTDRQGMHVAEVLQMALRERQNAGARTYPERGYTRLETPPQPSWKTAVKVGAAAGVAAAAALLALRHR